MNRDAIIFLRLAFAGLVTLGLVASRADAGFGVTDLGTLGGTGSSGFAINASGQVVGQSQTGGSGVPVQDHAFRTAANSAITPSSDLGTFGGGAPNTGPTSAAYGINASGAAVGVSDLATTSDPTNQVFPGHAFITNGSALRDLGTLAGATNAFNSAAYGINATGQVVGQSDTATVGITHAFITAINGGAMRDLGTLGDANSSSIAYAINASGQVVGQSDLAGGAATHAFLSAINGGALTDLGTLGGSFSTALGINNLGQVVGGANLAGDVSQHAFLYNNGGTLVDLGTLAGGTNSSAEGINAFGQIVGQSDTASGVSHAFLDMGGVMTDLNSLISPGSGLVLTDAKGINDLGQIVAIGIDSNGFNHALLLTTVPEPASLVMTGSGLLLGLLGYARRGRRRRESTV